MRPIPQNIKYQKFRVREEWSIAVRLLTSEMSKVYYPTVYDFTMLSFREISFLSAFLFSRVRFFAPTNRWLMRDNWRLIDAPLWNGETSFVFPAIQAEGNRNNAE